VENETQAEVPDLHFLAMVILFTHDVK